MHAGSDATNNRRGNGLVQLEGSLITKSKQHRLKMLLNDIYSNRYRLQTILTRLDDAQNARDISNILEQLVREEMLSHEQYEKLVELEELELPSVVEIIKETKMGQGLNYQDLLVHKRKYHSLYWRN